MASLPDELIIDILLRLPAETVHRFQSVCQKWTDLTSTSYFVESHMRQRSPAILLQEKARLKSKAEEGGGMELVLIEKWEEEAIQKVDLNIINLERPKCVKADSWHNYHPCLSYHGLIVLKGIFQEQKQKGFGLSFTDFIIYNPINQDAVRILTPKRLRGLGGEIYGLFLHPTLKEYCVVWGIFREKKVHFSMVNLGPQERQWKEIKADSSASRRPKLPPVQINDVLYWKMALRTDFRHQFYPTCDEFIMAFNIKGEEFSVMPHPEQISDCGHERMDLLKLDMHLSLVQISCPWRNPLRTTIGIWMLKDVAKRVWVKRYSINVEESCWKPVNTRAIAIVNGELLLQRDSKTYFVCNLQEGSTRKFEREFVGCCDALVHYKSFVSLRNCKPEIRMEENTRQTRARTAK